MNIFYIITNHQKDEKLEVTRQIQEYLEQKGKTCYIQQVKNIADQLAKADAKHADLYKKNAEAYIAKLNRLKQDMHAKLDPLKNRKIVTFHEAFPYFAHAYGLNPTGEPRTPESLLADFSWDKVPKGDICLPEGLF